MVNNALRDSLELTELDIFEKSEIQYGCSGMCESSLFYYTKTLDEGYPKETCLMHMKNNIASITANYASITILNSIFSLFLFITTAFMYQRPQQTYDTVVEDRAQNYEQADLDSSQMNIGTNVAAGQEDAVIKKITETDVNA